MGTTSDLAQSPASIKPSDNKPEPAELGKRTFRPMLSNPLEGRLQVADGPIDVLQLVETKKADTKRSEILRLVTLKRNTGGYLHPRGGELLSVMNIGFVSIADHNTGRFETGCCDAPEIVLYQ